MRYRSLVEQQRFTIRHHKLVNLGLLPSNSSRFGQSFTTKEAATKINGEGWCQVVFLGNQSSFYVFYMLRDCLILSNHGMDITTNTEFLGGGMCWVHFYILDASPTSWQTHVANPTQGKLWFDAGWTNINCFFVCDLFNPKASGNDPFWRTCFSLNGLS